MYRQGKMQWNKKVHFGLLRSCTGNPWRFTGILRSEPQDAPGATQWKVMRSINEVHLCALFKCREIFGDFFPVRRWCVGLVSRTWSKMRLRRGLARARLFAGRQADKTSRRERGGRMGRVNRKKGALVILFVHLIRCPISKNWNILTDKM